jgi:DNA helicase HerA-like ATPase
MRRIAVVGTSGSGKTTFAGLCAAHDRSALAPSRSRPKSHARRNHVRSYAIRRFRSPISNDGRENGCAFRRRSKSDKSGVGRRPSAVGR